jgi:hypothetical protein
VAKKTGKLKKPGISGRRFKKDFTDIVARYLSDLSADEQDDRIRAARAVAVSRRGASATKPAAREILRTGLKSRRRG